MVVAEGAEGEADHGRMDVDIVGDELDFCAALQRRNDGAGRAVGDAGHGIVEVGHVGGTGVKSRAGGIVAGAGVGDGDADLPVALPDELQRARLFGGHIHQLDEAVRALLQAAEHPHIGRMEVFRVLCADLFRADEGAFHVDADKVCALAVPVGRSRIHDAVQDLFREGHGRGADGQHTLAGFKVGQRLDGLFRSVAEVPAHGTVEMDVHKAGQSISTLGIQNFFARFRLRKGHDAPLPDEQVPLLERVAGGIDLCMFDDHN